MYLVYTGARDEESLVARAERLLVLGHGHQLSVSYYHFDKHTV